MTMQAQRVIVAEDDRALSNVLCFSLRRAGMEVTPAYDGRAAADLLAAGEFDLLVTDSSMPEMTGEELCQHVRGELQSKIAIVFCSAKGPDLDVDALRDRLGVSLVIHKPFSPKEVVKAIQELFEPAGK